KNYVVTPQLARTFNEALGFIRGSVESGRSAACYLDGSFGSGKSHFMTVLDLLLAGNVRARGVPELAEVVTRHDAILNGKRFLMVPYHMIGARDVETAILGGYADYVCPARTSRGSSAWLLSWREAVRGCETPADDNG